LPNGAYDEYSERGESENRNKELKCELCADRLSDHRYMANCFRMFLHCLANNMLVVLLPEHAPVRSQARSGEGGIAKNREDWLATLRRDGFVSLDADDKPGRIVTRPLTFESGQLHVNALVGDGGYLRAEVQDADGKILPSFAMEKSVKLTGDVPQGAVDWQDENMLRCPEGESLRVVFELRNAKLFLFWIE
jgi:hypothetical protein